MKIENSSKKMLLELGLLKVLQAQMLYSASFGKDKQHDYKKTKHLKNRYR